MKRTLLFAAGSRCCSADPEGPVTLRTESTCVHTGSRALHYEHYERVEVQRQWSNQAECQLRNALFSGV
jgi:hypothetical protein